MVDLKNFDPQPLIERLADERDSAIEQIVQLADRLRAQLEQAKRQLGDTGQFGDLVKSATVALAGELVVEDRSDGGVLHTAELGQWGEVVMRTEVADAAYVRRQGRAIVPRGKYRALYFLVPIDG